MKNDIIWNFKDLEREKVESLSTKLKITTYTAQLLLNRGIETEEEAKEFLSLPNSLTMVSWDENKSKEIGKRILEAVQKQELITVHGDYDVDGVTGAGVLAQFLKNKGANFNYFLPDRFGDGYGVSENTIRNLAQNGTKILITADCGIGNAKEIDLANELGIEVIVTDHHTLPEVLPNAKYIFHPALSEDKKFHILSGVGTAFQLICDIDKMIPSLEESSYNDYVDLVTIGTIADISPLKGINRSLVQYGVIKIRNTKRVGLIALAEKIGIDIKNITANDISYKIVPRLNAAGRMNKAVIALDLLMSDNYEKAQELAEFLESLNKERQKLCEETLVQVEELIRDEVDLKKDKAIVIAKEGFHHGVIGIICSRILEKYNRPTFIMAKEGEFTRGSARSSTMHLVDALASASDVLEKFGGHKGAAGWSLKTENFEAFRKKILAYANENISSKDLIPQINVEAEIKIEDINYSLFRELQELEPHGLYNPNPIIALKNCQVLEQFKSKDEKHLFFFIKNNENKIKANLWRGAHLYPLPEEIDITFDITENKMKNRPFLELKVNNIKEAHQDKVFDIYNLKLTETLTPIKLDFTELFSSIKNKLGYLNTSNESKEIIFKDKQKQSLKEFTFYDYTGNFDKIETLKTLAQNFGSDNLIIFSKEKKSDLFKEIGIFNSNNTDKKLILLDLPENILKLNYLINETEFSEIYLVLDKNSFESKIDTKLLKSTIKNLFFHNENLEGFIKNLKIDLDLLLIIINLLKEIGYFIENNDGKFLKIVDRGKIITEFKTYKDYLSKLNTYKEFITSKRQL